MASPKKVRVLKKFYIVLLKFRTLSVPNLNLLKIYTASKSVSPAVTIFLFYFQGIPFTTNDCIFWAKVDFHGSDDREPHVPKQSGFWPVDTQRG